MLFRSTLLGRALDGLLDLVLVPDATVAHKAVQAARGSRLRLMVVPKEQEEPTGLAIRVGGDATGKAVVARLLADAEVVPTLGDALRLWKPGKTLVCQDGALVRAEGVVVLGQVEGGVGAATLRRRREIAELKEQLSVADGKLLACRTALDRWRERVREGEGTLSTARQGVSRTMGELRGRESALTEARHRLRDQEGERIRAQRAVEALAIEQRALQQSRDSLEKEESKLEQQLQTAEARQAESEVRQIGRAHV